MPFTATPIVGLPPEVLDSIVKYLSPCCELMRVRCACRRLASVLEYTTSSVAFAKSNLNAVRGGRIHHSNVTDNYLRAAILINGGVSSRLVKSVAGGHWSWFGWDVIEEADTGLTMRLMNCFVAVAGRHEVDIHLDRSFVLKWNLNTLNSATRTAVFNAVVDRIRDDTIALAPSSYYLALVAAASMGNLPQLQRLLPRVISYLSDGNKTISLRRIMGLVEVDGSFSDCIDPLPRRAHDDAIAYCKRHANHVFFDDGLYRRMLTPGNTAATREPLLDFIISGAMFCSIANNHVHCAQYIHSTGHADAGWLDDLAIKTTAERGHVDALRWLLTLGEEVHPSAAHNHALMMSCRKGPAEMVRMLLEDGRVDPDEYNGTTFYFASSPHGHERDIKVEIMRLLMGTELVSQAKKRTYAEDAMRMAREKGWSEMVDLLASTIRIF
ncbi:hypothetical protein HK101_003943 [Irineochytrium annulatum]|nr:hypothetical protein HK101_003943 [Irineochytrium annulatum]